MEKYKDSDLTGKIIGAAMKVHSEFGNGFPEVVYQRCLAIEFKVMGIDYTQELEMPLFYRGQSVGKRRVDFLVEGRILVELKATTKLDDPHYAQIINYLTAYKLEIGLLINFGERSLMFKRFIKSIKAEKTS
jgi:GxxExxY protein